MRSLIAPCRNLIGLKIELSRVYPEPVSTGSPTDNRQDIGWWDCLSVSLSWPLYRHTSGRLVRKTARSCAWFQLWVKAQPSRPELARSVNQGRHRFGVSSASLGQHHWRGARSQLWMVQSRSDSFTMAAAGNYRVFLLVRSDRFSPVGLAIGASAPHCLPCSLLPMADMPVVSELTLIAVHPRVGIGDNCGHCFCLGAVPPLAFARSAPLVSFTCHVVAVNLYVDGYFRLPIPAACFH
jgi:hypothetical protein